MKNIKYLIVDVDGTLTDGKIYMGENGEVMKAFDVKDGCGISDIAIPKGIVPIVLTGRTSKILDNRCKELGILQTYQGVKDKVEKIKELISDHNMSFVAYIGDDIPDLPAMKFIKEKGGVIGCPADAAKNVVEVSDFVANHIGGNGAVRDFIEWLCV